MLSAKALLAYLLAVGAVRASPIAANDTEIIMLWNGKALVPVEVGITPDIPELSLTKRADINCGGVRGCTTSQSFKDDCSNAYYKIEDTLYTQGGTSSGVCSGKCGIFVAGQLKAKSCTASGSELSQAYNDIRSSGCQACGSESDFDSQHYSCIIKVDYVKGCTA